MLTGAPTELLGNAKEKLKGGGEVVLTSLNDNAKFVGGAVKDGGEVLLTAMKTDFNEMVGDFTNEFSAFELHAHRGETMCQMIWRLWLLIFLGINAAVLIGATIYIFVKGNCMYPSHFFFYCSFYFQTRYTNSRSHTVINYVVV